MLAPPWIQLIAPTESTWLPASESLLHLFILFVDACSSSTVQGKLAQLLDDMKASKLPGRVQRKHTETLLRKDKLLSNWNRFVKIRMPGPPVPPVVVSFKGKIPRVIRSKDFVRKDDLGFSSGKWSLLNLATWLQKRLQFCFAELVNFSSTYTNHCTGLT